MTKTTSRAAQCSFGAAIVFLTLLVLLHVIEPAFNPAWRMVSEYELGRYGWLMRVAFLSLTASSIGMLVVVRAWLQERWRAPATALLLLTAVGMALGAAFVTDPITTPFGALSWHGKLHLLGAGIGIPAMPLSASLITWALARRKRHAAQSLPLMAGLLVVMWGSLVVFCLELLRARGVCGPTVYIGWPNRIFIAAYGLWLAVLAWHADRITRRVLYSKKA